MELKKEYQENERLADEIRQDPKWPWVDSMKSKLFKVYMDNMDRIKEEIAKAVLSM
jgi:hypothetical protein